jgi:hypothetical protein
MQIDGQHAATYVVAWLAGFGLKDAETIAGVIQFDSNDYLYSRIASAHKMVDYYNLKKIGLQGHSKGVLVRPTGSTSILIALHYLPKFKRPGGSFGIYSHQDISNSTNK